jgi:ABC-2 type transport system ATP-binding protein
VVALLGPNGAGKTSTVEALEGYRRVDGGSVRVLGLDPTDHATWWGTSASCCSAGGVYPMLGSAQVLHLFSRYYDDPEDPDQLIELVGLGGPPHAVAAVVGRGATAAVAGAGPGGQAPGVLFLDEPTAGVDPEGRIVVRDIIAAQRDRGICVVLTTHELDEAERLADQVVIIDHGRKLAEGSPAALASGTADGSIRFTTGPGIDTAALAATLGSRYHPRRGATRLLPARTAGRDRPPPR